MNGPELDTRELKQALRICIQARLNGLDEKIGRAFTERIMQRLLELPEYRGSHSVFAYVSMAGEVGTHNLIRHSLRLGKRVCVPAFDREHQRYFGVEIHDFDRDLSVGYYGILEPRTAKPMENPTDLALIPGLAFDTRGNRLGRGKGFYDALLRKYRGVKVALAFECQIADEVPSDERDVPMDVLVTEERVIRAER